MEVKDTFLEKILQSKRKRLEAKLNRDASLDEIRARAHDAPPGLDLYQILSENEHLSLIAEIKRASPSKGIIRADLDPASQARAYQDFGASALSVLTEEDFFHGSLEDLKKAKEACHLPVLRKDFIFHAYQIYEARAWGADAVLLIAAMLSKQDLRELATLAQCLAEIRIQCQKRSCHSQTNSTGLTRESPTSACTADRNFIGHFSRHEWFFGVCHQHITSQVIGNIPTIDRKAAFHETVPQLHPGKGA